MRKTTLIIILLHACRLFAQDVWTDRARLLPDRLRNIPSGIQIWHSPTPVYPEINADTAYSGKYIWKHSTRVNSEAGDLEVIAAGSYIWWKDRGWTENVQLDKEGFANRFLCKGGILKSGRSYTFMQNYRHGDAIYPGDALWFVLAKDKTGRIYKGIALVETEGTLKQKNYKKP